MLGTQILATMVALFGFGLMEPLSWTWALFVWGYAIAWALLNDRVKLLAYWILDRTQAGATPEARAQRKSEPKVNAKPDAQRQLEPNVDAKPDAKAKTPSDSTRQIAARAYEIYQERLGGQSPADQDWLEAERETRKAESNQGGAK